MTYPPGRTRNFLSHLSIFDLAKLTGNRESRYQLAIGLTYNKLPQPHRCWVGKSRRVRCKQESDFDWSLMMCRLSDEGNAIDLNEKFSLKTIERKVESIKVANKVFYALKELESVKLSCLMLTWVWRRRIFSELTEAVFSSSPNSPRYMTCWHLSSLALIWFSLLVLDSPHHRSRHLLQCCQMTIKAISGMSKYQSQWNVDFSKLSNCLNSNENLEPSAAAWKENLN